VRSFAIITTEPNELCAALHHRMQAHSRSSCPRQGGCHLYIAHRVTFLSCADTPYPSDAMICWPVSARVGNVRNNDSSLIEPVAPA
jgi:putative SOS response-associated peptidase YedK